MAAEDKERRKREKQLKKERRKASTKYGQGEIKHSHMGRFSCIYAGASIVVLLACIVVSFLMRGNTSGLIGGCGIVSIVLVALGIQAAVKGMRERDRIYVTCKFGMAANILILLLLILIFIGGFM